MTREELLRALVVERYAPITTPPPRDRPVHSSSIDHPDPARPWTAHLMPADDAPDPLDDWDHWVDEPDGDPPSTTTGDGVPS